MISCHDHGNCELCDAIEKSHADLLTALYAAQRAMREPLDDWKGEVERKALDKAREAIAQAEAL